MPELEVSDRPGTASEGIALETVSVERPDSAVKGDGAEPRGHSYKVVADRLPGMPVTYITGGLHMNAAGGVYLYHPMTASREHGEIGGALREIKKHADYFTALFRKLRGFKEIPSILCGQGIDGNIYEVFLKAVPTIAEKEPIAFAVRQYESAERADLPRGLLPDGRPYTVLDRDAIERTPVGVNEYQMDSQMRPAGLENYTCGFNGLSLETCLFLSAFNMSEIVQAVDESRVLPEMVMKHGDEVRKYAEWQGIPKAAIYGRLGLLHIPGETAGNFVVTSALGDRDVTSEERATLYYWIDEHSYRPHLQHYQNRWSLSIVPLLRIGEEVSVSLLHGRGQRERLAIKSTKNINEIFDERGYTTISTMDLTQKFPTMRLADIMRPLLINTFLARNPALRVEDSLESPLDVNCRRRHVAAMMKGDGLKALEREKPFLLRDVLRELKEEEINESNPGYTKIIVDRIAGRCAASTNLPRAKPEPQRVGEEEFARRMRVKDTQLRQERYKQKYE